MNNEPTLEDVMLMSSDDEEDPLEQVECEEDWDGDADGPADPAFCIYRCLFNCQEAFETVANLFEHLKSGHEFDMAVLRHKFSMDQMSFIRMVNWRRSLSKTFEKREDLENLVTLGLRHLPEVYAVPWASDEWLKATIPDDPLLSYWFEEEFDETKLENVKQPAVEPNSINDVMKLHNVHLGNGDGDGDSAAGVGEITIESLQKQLHASQLENTRLLSALARVADDNQSMRKVMDRVMTDPLKSGKAEFAEKQNDDWYFDSYDELSIHAEMLKDEPRTFAYREAIDLNREDVEGKTVMDLGCGTGILSLFCVEAGAKIVHAVDNSKIIFDAMDICFENQCEGKVNFLAKKLETIDESEVGKVDILVSEWMGYFLNFEGMLASYLDARDKFLKPGGIMLPSTARIYLVAVSDAELYKTRIESWDDMYGYKMSVMKKRWMSEPAVHFVDKTGVASNEIVVKYLDLHTCNFEDTRINGDFELLISKECELTAICGYFSVGFEDCQQKLFLNTSPFHENTHWKQTLFYLPEKYKAAEDEVVKLHFECNPHPDNSRWLKVKINIFSRDLVYEMK